MNVSLVREENVLKVLTPLRTTQGLRGTLSKGGGFEWVSLFCFFVNFDLYSLFCLSLKQPPMNETDVLCKHLVHFQVFCLFFLEEERKYLKDEGAVKEHTSTQGKL